MNSKTSETDERVLDVQSERWQTTFASRAEMFGVEPSYAARRAAALFQREGKRRILELGSGQGRDRLFFVRNGF
jgi:tRNA G46 methylase TrmB